ncbi:MAG TPA: hypothetical protein VEO01_05130 [Pseudonocardiaceae bacterium]|nr:hypothetical protein [Pseudonocardiaceae bacterium]
MATLIGAVLLLALSYYAYRAAQRLVDDDRTRNPMRDRLGPDLDVERVPETAGQDDAPAEARERDLAHELRGHRRGDLPATDGRARPHQHPSPWPAMSTDYRLWPREHGSPA